MISIHWVILESTRVAYHPALAVHLTDFQHILMYVGNHGMGIHGQLCLKGGRLATAKKERTEHTFNI